MVTLNVKILSGLWEKSKGLIGVQKIEPIFLTTRWGIHTFGVRSPIDILILDDKNLVVSLRTLPPNRLFFWNPVYKNVIELPAGDVKNKGIKVGEKIQLHG